MTDLYLIAHKVRGEPAFDVATTLICSECNGGGCIECDGNGEWWIISTSGHRAYPWWSEKLSAVNGPNGYNIADVEPMPDPWPDHYTTRAEPQRSLIDILGIIQAPLTRRPPIKRRF